MNPARVALRDIIGRGEHQGRAFIRAGETVTITDAAPGDPRGAVVLHGPDEPVWVSRGDVWDAFRGETC